MFQIKARVDYGLQIMLGLAENPQKIIPVSKIAKRMGVSSVYLIQIAQSLFKAGLIKSKEGAHGGYYLAQAAPDISILQILEALDGKIELNCAIDKDVHCPQASSCQVRDIWGEILPELKDVLKNKNLVSLLK